MDYSATCLVCLCMPLYASVCLCMPHVHALYDFCVVLCMDYRATCLVCLCMPEYASVCLCVPLCASRACLMCIPYMISVWCSAWITVQRALAVCAWGRDCLPACLPSCLPAFLPSSSSRQRVVPTERQSFITCQSTTPPSPLPPSLLLRLPLLL